MQPIPGTLSEEQAARIIKRLAERGAAAPCTRCGTDKWHLEKQIALLPVDGRASAYPRLEIPSAVVICINCGHLAFHALSVLGLIDIWAPEAAASRWDDARRS